jgi:hypothetical protein
MTAIVISEGGLLVFEMRTGRAPGVARVAGFRPSPGSPRSWGPGPGGRVRGRSVGRVCLSRGLGGPRRRFEALLVGRAMALSIRAREAALTDSWTLTVL